MYSKPNLAYFPKLKEILKYEGHLGPDSQFLQREVECDHYFNPRTKEGDALRLAEEHFQKLKLALTREASDKKQAAFQAAYLSHYIFDLFTPPHIEETGIALPKMSRARLTIKFVKLVLRDKKTVEDYRHQAFETALWCSVMMRKIKRVLISEQEMAEIQNADIVDWLIPKVKSVYELQLFSEYKRSGWSRKISRPIYAKVLPEAIKSVALAWLGATANDK